ncbi:hypothetical protein ETU08_01755 [Apibacter muscae]|uniref:phage tail tape measure protein n=1 Tax=Apibacter muscae TaxID=2509004 RepID=UPI0011ACAA46|nr:phage tail tape measure protein [Apibacter muscae]TWP31230.1 hypothetical protein ETU08_01755 [Apibacter muscae]
MSDKETSWILSIIDRASKPVKEIMASVKECAQVVDKSNERIVMSEKQTQQALTNTKKHHKELEKQIKENEKQVKELEKAYEKAAPGTQKLNASKPLAESKRALQSLQEQLKETLEDAQTLEKDLENITNSKKSPTSLTGMMTGVNQTMEIIDKVSSMLDFTQPIVATRTEIERMTGISGKGLDDLTGKVHKLGVVFNENDEDIARAAHSMQTTWGGSYEEMLALMQKGYEKGGNINKEMLDSLKEYPKQLKEAGLSASESIALIAQANKQGVYSDKAIDSIKEMNLALREMDKPQVEALQGIGISGKDLKGKTTMDVAKLISEKMKGASSQAQQKVLADIFKAAGEDAGKEFILGLSTMDLNLENLPSVKQAGAGIKGIIADIQSKVATSVGTFAPYLQTLGSFSTQTMGVISLVQTLGRVTVVQTIATKSAALAQRAWNLVMVANPIGAVIASIAALGAMVYKIRKDTIESTEAFKQQASVMRVNEELNKYAIQTTNERITKLKNLTRVATDERISLVERKKALGELIKEDARYQSSLQNGIILTDQLRRTTEQLTQEIYNNALTEGRKKLIAKTAEEVELAKLEEKKWSDEIDRKSKIAQAGHVVLDIVNLGVFSKYDAAKETKENKERDLQNLIRQDIQADRLKNGLRPQKGIVEKITADPLTPTLDDYSSSFSGGGNKKGDKKGSNSKNGLRISGGSGGGKTITQNLTINNYFTRGNSSDDRSFADKVITQINDGLRDGLATI